VKSITATQAARAFSDMLDAVERQEWFLITRDGRAIAEVRPARERTLGALFDALSALPRDPEWADETEQLRDASPGWEDRWSG
jgi:antitoxin (DNA-binding transcriptional repressor) of toxin-antitoxin stability system